VNPFIENGLFDISFVRIDEESVHFYHFHSLFLLYLFTNDVLNSDIKNDLAIKFIPNARAEYTVNFYIKNENIRQIKVGTKQQEIIESSLYSKSCIQNEECTLIVEIKLNENNVQNIHFELETTIKSISIKEKYPSYLIKNKINREYLNYKSPNYYFTDIGQKISGEIIINYYRVMV